MKFQQIVHGSGNGGPRKAAICALWRWAQAQKYPSLSLRWHWALISTALRFGTVIQRCFRGQGGAGRQRCSGPQSSIGCGAFAAIGERKNPPNWDNALALICAIYRCLQTTIANHIEIDSLLEMYHRHRLAQGDCSRFLEPCCSRKALCRLCKRCVLSPFHCGLHLRLPALCGAKCAAGADG